MKKLLTMVFAVTFLTGCSEGLNDMDADLKELEEIVEADKAEKAKEVAKEDKPVKEEEVVEKEEPKKEKEVVVKEPAKKEVKKEPAKKEVAKEVVAFTDVELEYLEVIMKSMEVYSEKMNDVATLMDDSATDPSLLLDMDWKNKISGNFMIVTMLTSVIADMEKTNSVPIRFKTLHEHVYNGFHLMSMANDKTTQAIEDGFDAGLLSESEKLASDSGEEFNAFTVELKRLKEEVVE